MLFDLGDFNGVDDATAFEITRPSLALSLALSSALSLLCALSPIGQMVRGKWIMAKGTIS